MMKKALIIISILILSIDAYGQAGSYAGSFARFGFGARSLAMGNAMVGNTFGDVPSYYNPALSSYQEEGIVNIAYTFMSLDRTLNSLNFSKKVTLPNQPKGGAGFSVAWLNAGVSDIDGRDNDTRHIGMFSTFDNQFYLGTSFIVDEKVSIGIGFKYYYSKLFDDVTSTSIAFDGGITVKPSPVLSLGASIRDLSAKNEWNTSDIYGTLNGNTTTDKFPTLFNLGGTYLLPNSKGMVSLEAEYQKNPSVDSIETSNNIFFKIGGEINLSEQFKLRAGLDRIEPGSDDMMGSLRPAAGFGFSKMFGDGMRLGLDYSFQFEPYTHNPIQNVNISFKFK